MLRGVEVVPVDVEVAVTQGIPAFNVVGMADAAVQESRERVRAALRVCGYTMPANRIIVNLAPSSLKKSGSGFDLPIAVGILCATGQVSPDVARDRLFVGELSLEGAVRPVAGLLAYALCARDQGIDLVCANAPERMVEVEGVRQFGLDHLGTLHERDLDQVEIRECATDVSALDYGEIAGNEMAKRALQIAAAGRHGVLMMGPPGSGKTMLASRFPSILPPLSRDEAFEAALIHSVAGEDITSILAGVPPFRAPHHSASMAGLVGGGTPVRPGEISLAHHGVLFMDELPEFRPSVLQAIRQPVEQGRIVITRADGNVVFPARFMLVAAANPCPCGFFGDPERTCTCSPTQISAYQNRIGGPLMDRIDIHIDVQRVPPSDILEMKCGTTSAELQQGVLAAREYASWRKERASHDSTLAALLSACQLEDDDRVFFEKSAHVNQMSGRAIVRTLAVARTIADMEQRPHVNRADLCEALGFRVREGVR